MLQIIIFIFIISLVLYTILGGADFGAGIVETFYGSKDERTVSNALAPVWEANHVWLILAIVILFTGFPQVYTAISIHLHIPLMIILIGIVLRGSSFIFSFYDVSDHQLHNYFTIFFKIASFITPVFLGITFGAMTSGSLNLDVTAGFYERFIHPWCNLFCLIFGLFAAALFAYIAAAFLIGETEKISAQKKYSRLATIFLVIVLILGVVIFLMAAPENTKADNYHLASVFSIIAFAIAVLLTPVILYLFKRPHIIYLRAAVGLQVSMAISGWFATRFPVLVFEKNGNHLSFFNSAAPDATLHQLLIALFVGLALIMPAFYFLFKVFKKTEEKL